MNESADFVMYWWDRAAELLTRKGTRLRRFGLVTTNSLTQVFQRRVLARHFKAKPPSLATDGDPRPSLDESHPRSGSSPHRDDRRGGRRACRPLVRDNTKRKRLDTDEPQITMRERDGYINSDLTIGADVTKAVALASQCICLFARCEAARRRIHCDAFAGRTPWAWASGRGSKSTSAPIATAATSRRDRAESLVIDLFGLAADEVQATVS